MSERKKSVRQGSNPSASAIRKKYEHRNKNGVRIIFSDKYFGIKVDLDGKNKKQPGVYTPGCFYAEKALYIKDSQGI